MQYGFSTGQLDYAQDNDNSTLISFVKFGETEPSASITFSFENDTDYTVLAIGDGQNNPISLLIIEDDFRLQVMAK